MDTTLILLVAALVASPCRSQSPGPEDDSASTTTAAAPTTAQRPLEGVLPKEVSKGVLNTLTGQPVLDGVKGLMEAAGLPASNTTLNDLKETLVKSGLSILEKANNNRKSLFKGVGAQCSFDAECSASFSTCSGNKCTCKQDYIVSTDSATCLPVAKKLGDRCSEDAQCTQGLERTSGKTACINFQCSCPVQHAPVKGWCIGQSGLGTVCVEDSDCKHVELSVCLQGVCACGRDRLPAASGLNCVPLAKSEMDECEEDSQCSYNLDKAYCKDSKCVCQPFNHIVAGKCVPIKALGDSCSINDECRKPEEENDSVRRGCLDNKCACVKGKQEQDLCTSGCGSPTESWQTIGGLVVTLLLANMIAN